MNTSFRTLQVYRPDPGALYSIDQAASQLGMTRRGIALCCKYGLVSAASSPLPDGWYFDAETLGALRRVAALQARYGGTFAGVRRILELEEELDRLRVELRRRRE